MAARTMNAIVGNPGIIPIRTNTPEAISRALGCAITCDEMSLPRLEPSSLETRVVMIPAVIEMRRAGTCATRPSPIESREYTFAASPAVIFFTATPMIRPAMMLMRVMTMPAMASPLTNFMAPSIEPYSWLSFWISRRFARACAWSRVPARRSASMAICLPGMASRVKRAATSATRSAPLVMTINCTRVMIKKITPPTI